MVSSVGDVSLDPSWWFGKRELSLMMPAEAGDRVYVLFGRRSLPVLAEVLSVDNSLVLHVKLRDGYGAVWPGEYVNATLLDIIESRIWRMNGHRVGGGGHGSA